jgi:hypothetical protein
MSKALKTNASKNDKIKKIVLLGTGITATGIAAYFGWQYYKKSQDGSTKKPSSFSPPKDPIPEYVPSNTTPKDSSTSYTPPYQNANSNSSSYSNSNSNSNSTSNNNSNSNIADAINNVYQSIPKTKKDFPLKRGSRNMKVRQLQDALLATHGASILPRYGADGDFGSELANALKKLHYPSSITESLFHVITNGSGSNNNSLAKQFVLALSAHDFIKTSSLLKTLKSKTDYSTVSNEFKTYRVNGGVRQTLVNACLNAFVDAKQKQAIRL